MPDPSEKEGSKAAFFCDTDGSVKAQVVGNDSIADEITATEWQRQDIRGQFVFSG